MLSQIVRLAFTCLLCFCLFACSEPAPDPLFSLQNSMDSGLKFANNVAEDDTYNILDFEFVYNGGGVAIADFNGDDLQDVYFTGNTTSNALYLNKGNLKFEDITKATNTQGAERWCSGVVACDVNGDGRMDLYVSATVLPTGEQRKNLLYINQGNDAQGFPQFLELGEAYGIADTTNTTQAAFLDYDRDGDLDLYLVVNEMDNRLIPNRYVKKVRDGKGRRNDRLYRNDGDQGKGHPEFSNVTAEAGINMDGYGLGISICDLNKDGWPDIYVTNDYVTNDLLWINNQDGTFTDRADEYFKHTGYSAMGNDVADLNNDGLDDVVALDMFPESNSRRKAMMPANNYFSYINNDRYNYQYQFTRNVLQLNQGQRPGKGDSEPIFAEVGRLAGIAATDWSWSTLAADVDFDGDRDLLITNGFPKDVTDHDFMDYNMSVGNIASRETLLPQIPSVKIANYGLANDGGHIPTFQNKTAEWGLSEPSYSNGAAYADLDNDGDLDYIVNNINQECFLYRNNLMENKTEGANFLAVRLQSQHGNTRAVGARVDVRSSDETLLGTAFQQPVRGYLSSVTQDLYFGVDTTKAKYLDITWPEGGTSRVEIAGFNRMQIVDASASSAISGPKVKQADGNVLFQELPGLLENFGPHKDSLFIDFNVQPLLPHLLSEYGPGLAVADVNGDGLDDLYRSGSHFYGGELLLQQPDATFTKLPFEGHGTGQEELGSLFFDADGDGDVDLYLASGGSELSISSDDYLDRLFLNDGTGHFELATGSLPPIRNSASCVRAADFDRDGDLDLFVGGRLAPARYPEPVNSYLLVNDGKGNFTEAEKNLFERFGLVTDALFTDYDGDGWVDLLVVGQGMAVRMVHNNQGALEEQIPEGFTEHVGWWNGITGADFDQDGDVDYVLTNYGSNNLYHQGREDFVALYGADFDRNGGFDLLVGDRALGDDGQFYEYPHYQRRDTEKQLIKVKDKYPKHRDFAQLTMAQFLHDFTTDDLVSLKANYLRSAWMENLGDGQFEFHDLPMAAQVAPLFGALATDLNGDGYPDLVAIGNDYGAEPGGGRVDALNGIALLFDATDRKFSPVSTQESGFFVPGNGRTLVSLRMADDKVLVAAENQGPTKAYRLPTGQGKWYLPKNDCARLKLTHTDGRKSVVECYYGSGFLSQSGRAVWLGESVTDVTEEAFR